MSDLGYNQNRHVDDDLLDFSCLQEIGFGVMITRPDGRKQEQRVRPNAHFRAPDGKEYFIFYNDEVPRLLAAVEALLDKEIKEHKLTPTAKRKVLERAKSCSESRNGVFQKSIHPAELFIPLYNIIKVTSVLASDCSLPPLVEMHAIMCSNLRKVIDTVGPDFKSGRICALIVDKELKENFSALVTPKERYPDVEQRLSGIAASRMSDRDMVIAMEKYVDEMERIINPRLSESDALDFCFTLNRASFYLTRLEGCRQFKDPATLRVMHSFRRKLNRLMLEYRFIFERNTEPLLGIKIADCKIIAETEALTMIFLDRIGTREFIRKLSVALDNKATNLMRKYPDDSFSGQEIRQLAESLDPDSYDDMIRKLDSEMVDMQADARKQKVNGSAELAKCGLKVVQEGAKFALSVASGGASTAVGYAASAAAASAQTFSQEQVEEFLQVQNLQSGSRPGRRNLSAVGTALSEMNVDSQTVQYVADGLNCFIESRRIEKQIAIIKKQRERIAADRDYTTDFINLVKLYLRLKRGKLEERDDYDGVLIRENRTFVARGGSDLLREYTVHEIHT